MSLILNSSLQTKINTFEECSDEGQRDIDRLDRYLAIIENNKKASYFVPNDALVALDMAGYALAKIAGKRPTAAVSAARLALALVQPCAQMPIQ